MKVLFTQQIVLSVEPTAGARHTIVNEMWSPPQTLCSLVETLE